MTPALSAISTPLARELSNHLWQSTLFAAIVALLALALRRYPARARYWLWLAASAKFLVPFSLLIAIGAYIPHPTHSTPTQTTAYVTIDELSQPFTDAPSLTEPVASSPTPAPTHRLTLPKLLAALWLIGFLTILTRWLVQLRRIAKSIRNATPLLTGRVPETLRRIEHLAHIARPIPILSSPASNEPASMEPGVFGVLRPVLLWPEAISAHLDDAHLEAILAHEAAHVRRRDNLTSLLPMLVEALFWFHPLVWWMESQLVKERERACDEEVLLLCHHPQAYAESILKVCELCIESPLTCVSGITGADLKRRIVQIMTARIARKLGLGAKLLLLTAASLAIAMPILLGHATTAQRMMLAAVDAAPSPIRTATHAALPIEPESITPSNTLIALQAAREFQLKEPVKLEQAAAAMVPAAPSIKFDVISFKRCERIDTTHKVTILPPDGDSIGKHCQVLRALINLAYDSASPYLLKGEPDWVDTDPYDFQAKVAPQDVPAWQKMDTSSKRLMVRAALAEALNLRMHTEIQSRPVYNLVVAKGGPKLTESKPDPNATPGAPPNGDVHWIGIDEAAYTGTTMAGLASGLTARLDRNVIDKTGLAGYYDFHLKPLPFAHYDPKTSDVESTDFAAIIDGVKNLGLSLEPAKADTSVLVIDHIDRPTEN